ncbi:hypothetical protein ACS0TY_015631 [Phlomoides rotata]
MPISSGDSNPLSSSWGDQPDLDALEYAVNKSKSVGAEDAVIDSVTEQKDVVPLDKFLPPSPMAKCSDELQMLSEVLTLSS